MKTKVIHYLDETGADNEVYIYYYFANPIEHWNECIVCGIVHQFAFQTLPCYKKWLHWKIDTDTYFKLRLEELKGKTLVCQCKPQPCHGDVLVAYLDGEEDE